MREIDQQIKIKEILDKKTPALQEKGFSFLRPGDGIDADTQAKWLIQLLCQMYVTHGITRNPKKITEDIKNGDVRCWFAIKDGLPVATAALIKQRDGAVEIGRAVALENGRGSGGFLMLAAALEHFVTEPNKPLVAEIRIADNFQGIPSGEATQKICFQDIGLKPHAVVPAFGHGQPHRQEMFLFSSSEAIKGSHVLFLPRDSKSRELLTNTVFGLAKEFLSEVTLIESTGNNLSTRGWGLVQKEPFGVIIPDDGNNTLATTIKQSEKNGSFTLLPLELNPQSSSKLIEALNNGFIPCGIDRNLGGKGELVVLLGRLKHGTSLAPSRILAGVLDKQQENAISIIEKMFMAQV